ncbi:MAG: hypothetical protein H6734_11970 [Alphaproteobacteria bacterium]|nr:hypothetical protein [Alphaproteobacteria bacterium]
MTRILLPLGVLGLALGCGSGSAPLPGEMDGWEAPATTEAAPAFGGGGLKLEEQEESRRAFDNDGVLVRDVLARPAKPAKRSKDALGDELDEDERKPEPPADGAASAARVRQWFPEAFLWRPSVVTDGDGVASVDVRVPDQLTDWRVLALAHDRGGHQAGTERTFASVLPVSVDPVTPGWLYVGDTLRVPAQASALARPFAGRLELDADGALSGSAAGPVALLPGGSALVPAALTAERSGSGTVRTVLFDAEGRSVDAAERSVDVRPTGRPVETLRGGVLSAARTLDLDDPRAAQQDLAVRVFPGPLAVFQAELARVADRPPGAYGYALVAGIRALSASAHVDVDEDALRTLRIRAWQRLVRASRSPDGPQATALLTGLVVPEDDPLAATTHARLVRTLEAAQRGDGTWSAQARSNVQHVLVQTAAAARALPDDRKGARLRAAGALERLLPNVDDPYTAAWLLASGVLDTSLRPALEARVLEGIEDRDGVHTLRPADPRLKGPMGHVSRAEHLAVTWLALAHRDDLPWKGDLLAELLQGWSASSGLGAGWADAIALQAIQKGLPAIDAPVTVSLERDGLTLATGALDPAQPKLPVTLLAQGAGPFTVRTEPPVPGLVFSATHTAWVPFDGSESLPGVEVHADASGLLAGQDGWLTLTVSAPSGASVSVHQGLPAGTVAEIDPASLPLLTDHEVFQDHLELTTRAFGAGDVLEIRVRVTPMFAGRMATRPLHVAVGRESADLAPLVWDVRSGGVL